MHQRTILRNIPHTLLQRQKIDVRVNLVGQPPVGVTHEFLGDPWNETFPLHPGIECESQGMKIRVPTRPIIPPGRCSGRMPSAHLEPKAMQTMRMLAQIILILGTIMRTRIQTVVKALIRNQTQTSKVGYTLTIFLWYIQTVQSHGTTCRQSPTTCTPLTTKTKVDFN